MAFLKANQKILYNTIASGSIVDFHVLPKLPHVATKVMDPSQWYLCGESSFNADPFYSTGMVVVSNQVQLITHAILAQETRHPDAYKLIEAYNDIALAQTFNTLFIINRHWNQLGNASALSWRICLEGGSTGGAGIAAALSKWHLCPASAAGAKNSIPVHQWLMSGIYDILDDVVKMNINIGLLDYNEPLPWIGFRGKNLLQMNVDADDIRIGGKWGFKRVNIFRHNILGNQIIISALSHLVYRTYGIAGFFKPVYYERILFALKNIWRLYPKLLRFEAYKLAHAIPANDDEVRRREEFKTYKGPTSYVDWMNDLDEQMNKSANGSS